jgi:HlyD family secretion protein/epimerase transport system membrane fusion protein
MTRLPLDKIITNKKEAFEFTKHLKLSIIVVATFIAIFLLWAIFSRIDAAAIAQGKIVLESKKQTVEHLEGGIIEKIYVKDGSKVKLGEPLLKLSNIQAKVSLDEIKGQLFELLLQKARLKAEQISSKNIIIPPRLKKIEANININQIIEAQTHIFNTNRKAHLGQIDILNYKITQMKQGIKSLEAQAESVSKQILLIEEELEATLYLEKRKLIEKPKVLALKREHARLMGNKGEYLGNIAKIKQKIAETRSQLLTLEEERLKKILAELRETHQTIIRLIEREKSAKDVLDRTIIRAPMSGIIVGLQEHSQLGVVTPGQPILDIIPDTLKYVIDAKISPLDIDVVHPDLVVKIQLTAYKQRSAPILLGKVSHVSADIFEDKKTGEQYYKVKVTDFQKELAKLKNIPLYSGMPVQIMIIIDNRSPLSYLVSPLTDSFYRSFREN